MQTVMGASAVMTLKMLNLKLDVASKSRLGKENENGGNRDDRERASRNHD